MTDEQKSQIELAARINGVSISQWSMNQLMESARRVIAERHSMKLDSQSFDQFCELLEQPIDARFAAFQHERTRWDD